MGFGFGFIEAVFPIMFILVFTIVIGTFAVSIFSGIKTWNKNNQSPRLSVEAKVIGKRIDVSHYHHGNAGDAGCHTSSSTDYYVTFQVESGDRMEFSVPGKEYGMLIEGDMGKLSFQGTRYLSFERR